ncbi:MAG: DUF167 domain-containing protein [Alphaproteobacteria bacterium]|nr:DUF167 domain-containing protein [Alphaproteobacteria bacterium]MCW5741080.1 DUF167 domain-containing protein [Alphaproteobacteria bacterium]
MSFWTATRDGVRLRLKVRPQARRVGIDGLVPDRDGEALSISVTAAPEDGKANAAVIALLARALDVARSAISVTQGAAARRKTIHVAGDPAALGATLETWRESPP